MNLDLSIKVTATPCVCPSLKHDANTSAHNRSSACRQWPGPTMGNAPRWFLLASVIICQLFHYDHHYYSINARSCHFCRASLEMPQRSLLAKLPIFARANSPKQKLVKSLSHSQIGALQKGIGTLFPKWYIRCICMGLTRKGAPHPQGFSHHCPQGIELNNVAFGRSRAPGFLLPGSLKFHSKFCPWKSIEILVGGFNPYEKY